MYVYIKRGSIAGYDMIALPENKKGENENDTHIILYTCLTDRSIEVLPSSL